MFQVEHILPEMLGMELDSVSFSPYDDMLILRFYERETGVTRTVSIITNGEAVEI